MFKDILHKMKNAFLDCKNNTLQKRQKSQFFKRVNP